MAVDVLLHIPPHIGVASFPYLPQIQKYHNDQDGGVFIGYMKVLTYYTVMSLGNLRRKMLIA